MAVSGIAYWLGGYSEESATAIRVRVRMIMCDEHERDEEWIVERG